MEEKKPLTDAQRVAKEILDEELETRKKKLQAEIDALDSIDTEQIARKIGEKREEGLP